MTATNPSERIHTLCWDCARATGDCSWSNHYEHKPVKGWKAIGTSVKNHSPSTYAATCESYIVQECPSFLRDAEGFGARRIGKKAIPAKKQKERDADAFKEKQSAERRTIQAETEKYRQAIIQAYECGITAKEIATITGIPEQEINRTLKQNNAVFNRMI